MIRNSIFVLFFAISISSIGSINISYDRRDSIKISTNNCMKAELMIVDNKFDSALYYYSKALCYSFIMPRDQQILFSITTGISFDYIRTVVVGFYSWIKFKNGETRLFLNNFPLSRNLDSTQKEIIAKDIDILPVIKRTLQTNNHVIDSVILSLENSDQKWRLPDVKKTKKVYRKMRKADKKNFKTILKLYNEYGSFAVTYLKNQTVLYMIIKHNFSDKKLRKKYLEFFENEVIGGNIHPKDLEWVVDSYLFDSTQVYGNHTAIVFNDTLICYKLSEAGSARINKNRYRINLEDIKSKHKKIIWQFESYDKIILSPVERMAPAYIGETVYDFAEKHRKLMGSMVDGYDIYTR
jgi:hypothetical protein